MRGVVKKIIPESGRFARSALRWRANPIAMAQRYWALYNRRRFSPDEIHFFGLLDPRLDERDLACVVSKEELLDVQRRLNPTELHDLTEDKLRFHTHCRAHDLPVPQVYGVFGVADPDAHGISVIADLDALAAFLSVVDADRLILKPIDGVHGHGVSRLERSAHGWTDHAGVPVTPHGLLRRMEQGPYRQWMLQQCVQAHPDLEEFSQTRSLQTVRVVTHLDSRDEPRILAARLRLVSGTSVHDNFDYGRTGNVIANLDVDEGTIRSVVGSEASWGAIGAVTHHPRTGRPLLGYRVPNWPAARRLVLGAACAFAPLRSIGWDVAITAGEPSLIEGNVTWDTLSGEPRMGEIYRYLRQEASGLDAA